MSISKQENLITKHKRKGERPKFNLLSLSLVLLCFQIQTSYAQVVTPPPIIENQGNGTTQNITYNTTGGDSPLAEMPKIEDNYYDKETQDSMKSVYGEGRVNVKVSSIEPEGGPTDGSTRVLVRGGPFHNMLPVYPYPKCRFGSNSRVVNATYVTCSQSPTPVKDNEPKSRDKNETCVQCDDSPPSDKGEIVPLTVSLVGDFSDCMNSVAYRYYQTPHIWAFQPRLGLKDGDTRVEVWGENFLNFDELSVCNFGSVSVKAEYINSTRLICTSPHSDVVEKGVPFSVSFNKQQNTMENMTYWFYNRPAIALLSPNVGADQGGFPVFLIGQNYHPSLEGFNYTNTTFCNFQRIGALGKIGSDGRIPATLIDSTHVKCVAPSNEDAVEYTEVELTLNDQQYTDDNVLLYYIRTPKVFDVDPREGPTKGGTVVMIFGDRFENSKNLTCKFGTKKVPAIYISQYQAKCVSPPYEKPGWVTLQIANGFDKWSTESVKYYYYETPEIFNITPTCGPQSGYTQITVHGKNFRNTGFGKAVCIFNDTLFMNATIMDEGNIKCDSPQLLASQAIEEYGAPFYFVSLTLDGGKSKTESKLKFVYYRDPVIESITPDKGPIRGGTISKMRGSGFQQEGVCNVTVRFGAIQHKITNVTNFTDKEINMTVPPAALPSRVQVSIALNGQQFINDKVFHLTDTGNKYTYYQDVYIKDYSPKAGPTTGKTKVKVQGMGFNQFRDEDGKKIEQPIFVRFIDQQTGERIGDDFQAYDQSDEEFTFRTPPAGLNTKAIMEISYNQQDWQKVIPPNQTHSYQYYNAPHITGITPAYGPVKSPNNETIQISGNNFECQDSDCSNIWVRFGDPENGIYVRGQKMPNGNVEAQVPKYTKPDVLPVEISFNGQDFTNDNNTYGFFDPFILDIQPRLINIKGTTKVRLYGFGFVNSTGSYLKTKFGTNYNRALDCNGKCVKMAEYIDKSTIESTTFPQNIVTYADNGETISFNGMATEASVYGDTYTENGIEIYYYEDPIYQNLSQQGSPANQEKPIFITTDYLWHVNEVERFKKYANFTCRFRNANGNKVIYTKARMEVYPLGNAEEELKPSHVKCNSPKWGVPEQVKLDISLNGQDYSGDFNYQFYDNLDLYRIYPMAGPNEGNTRVTLFGSGFSTSREEVYARWGVLYAEQMIKEQVRDYIWNETYLIQSEADKGNQILRAYKEETFNDKEYYFSKRRDYELYEGQKLVTYVGQAPKLNNWNRTHGGPIYMSVGSEIVLNVTNYTIEDPSLPTNITTSYYNKTLFVFSHSYVEYYYYQQPVVKKVEPLTGYARGGTRVVVSGAWFKYKPEYGIVPHCKIGEKISRAQFFSTVRIVCLTPPHTILYENLPIFVSLNGFDFVDTGFHFQYEEQVALQSMYPQSGEEGTMIYFTGANFPRFAGNSKFKCKFTDLENDRPPKHEYVYWKDNSTIQCSAPKGFVVGGTARVQVTFNGEDYSDNNFTFSFYKLNGVFPNSGPNDGSGGPILILGEGFKPEMDISCNFNNTIYTPLEVTNKFIKCPMPAANRSGETFPQRVDFIFQIDQAQKKQYDGFWYYDQISAVKMEPNIGPAQGRGLIDFEVKGLLKDYEYFWAQPGCKIGDSQGKGKILGDTDQNTTIIQCMVEDMELVDKDYYLPATVALNSYSWVDTDFKFVPYGILDIYPNSGPIAGNTDVTITGKGFSDELQEKAQCRFGVGNYQVIVPADILDYEKILCRTPPGFQLPTTSELPFSVPISISLSDKEAYNPWTESPHRFTFYAPPKIITVEPEEIEIGVTKEIYLTADDDSEFLQPIPTYKNKKPSFDIQCRFGRFKDSIGTFLNKTTIKCAIPSIKDDPDTIYRETVKVLVAQNGKDFDEDNSDVEVTFVGTGSPLGFWSAILATLLIGLLIVAILFYGMALWDYLRRQPARQEIRGKDRSYVIKDAYDQFTSRAYTSGMMGRSDPSYRS